MKRKASINLTIFISSTILMINLQTNLIDNVWNIFFSTFIFIVSSSQVIKYSKEKTGINNGG